MFICMLYVALAKFEYAMQLKIRFGTLNKMNIEDKKKSDAKVEGKCRKIDCYALRIFLGVYMLTVGIYFYNLSRNA